MDTMTLDTGWESLAAQAQYRPRELAKLCNVSLRTLQRWFTEDYGTTVGDWLRTVRLTEAYRRITAGESIKYVAYDLGFKQLSHFSRAFKQVHGIAPSMVSPKSSRTTMPADFPAPRTAVLAVA